MVHLTRDLVEILLKNLIVPSASGLGDVDGLTHTLKRGIVSYVIECGDAPKDALARIFDKSDRWIYRQLEEMDGRKERRHLGEDHAGYELMVKVVEFFASLYPKETSAAACVHALRRSKIDVVVQTLEPILNLCVDQGYLTRTVIEAGGQRETLYRAISDGMVVGSLSDVRDRKSRIGRRVRSIFPMLRSYLQGHPLSRCLMISMGLPEDKVQIFLEKSQEYMTALMKELHEEMEREQLQSGVSIEYPEFRVLLLAGPGPYNDHVPSI